jgi:uncharacterized YccA/Bax inhibitor family protein
MALIPTNQSGNPTLKNAFRGAPRAIVATERMTLSGTINKSFLMLAVLLIAALYPWSAFYGGEVGVAQTSMLVGMLGGFILAMVLSFKAQWAPFLALPYAALQGLALGGVSALFERRYPGIAIQAVALTFAVFAVMLVAFRAGLIRATERFRAIVIGATGAIALVYLVSLVLGLFHVQMPLINAATPLGIGISLVIVAVAAMNLILDFDLIESGAASGAPRYMEWYASFALLVTLVWLYIEMLRLLSKARRS